MMPWEKYAGNGDSAPVAALATGPWAKYQTQAAPTAPTQPDMSKHADSIVDKLIGGGEAALSTATSIPAGIAGQVAGIGKTLTGGKFGTQAGIQQGQDMATKIADKLTYLPRTAAGKEDVAAIGKAFDTSKLAGLPVEGQTMGQIPRVPAVAKVVAEGAGDITKMAGKGVMAGPKAVGKAAMNAMPEIDPETAKLAKEAHDMGFRIDPHQVYASKYGKYAGEMASENPLINNNREFNQKVFNQQLVKAVGSVGDKLTRKTYNDAMRASGETIGDIAAKTPLPIDRSLLVKLRSNSANQLPEVATVVNSYVNTIDKLAGEPPKLLGGGPVAGNRMLPGAAFRRINTDIGKHIRDTSNGDLKSALNNLQDDLQEARSQHLSSQDRVAYDAARKFYAVGKQLEPLVAKSPTGDIPPSALLGAISNTKSGKSMVARGAAGDLGKLADIGQKFLKSQPSSGTAERTAVQNIVAHPIGSLAGGAVAAATAPMSAAYNKYGPGITQRLIGRPPKPNP